MTFQFTPAVRENVSLLIALAGPSGSGKTKSALRLAEGLADGGPIAFIDTEARRALHYADAHKFMHADMRPPFRPARFIEAIHAAEQAGAKVIIIDSFSHEYDGEDGILDWAAELEEKGTKPPGNWKVPKLAHKKLMNDLLQCRASIIFCLRADEKIEIVRENGRTQVRPLGWIPIAEKRFLFEMTASFTMTADNPGKPNYHLPHTREIETFSDVDPEMQINTMLVFLYVAQRGVCTQKDLELGLGLTNGTASRSVSYWCDQKTYNKEGIGFIERTENPRDRRYKLLRLTKAGLQFYKKVRADKSKKGWANPVTEEAT